jgi:hypothetical protein
MPDAGIRINSPRLGQIGDLIPKRNTLRVDRLNRAPIPDDVEIVKALIIYIIAFRFSRGLALGLQEILLVEDDLDIEILLSAPPQFLEQRNFRSENTQRRAWSRMNSWSRQFELGVDPGQRENRLELLPFRLNRNDALDSCIDAFSSGEPVSASLENALEPDEGQEGMCAPSDAFSRMHGQSIESGERAFDQGRLEAIDDKDEA